MTQESWGIVGYRHFTDQERFEKELADIVASRGGHPRAPVGCHGLKFVEHLPKTNTAYELLARNTLIVRDSDVIIAFLSKQSRGTLDTLKKAREAGKETNID